jgi:hypothetical protein
MSQLKIVFIVFALLLCVSTCSRLAYEGDQGVTTIPDPAPAIERVHILSDLTIIMDHTTGCQYIETSRGIEPRMNADSTQYCIANLESPNE